MRLVSPASGSVHEVTDPRAITYLRYNKGYWTLDDADSTAFPQQQQEDHSDGGVADQWVEPDDEQDLQAGYLPG